MSQQVLVTPPWRSSARKSTSTQSASNMSLPNITTSIPTSSCKPERHTIWDVDDNKPRKYPASVTGDYSSSWENKPNYFPTKSHNHFSFLPKPETKPGNIAPAYLPTGSRQSSASKLNKQARPDGDGSSPEKPQELRKSCLKSQSTQSLKSRSQSPSMVKFSPKLPKRVSGMKFDSLFP